MNYIAAPHPSVCRVLTCHGSIETSPDRDCKRTSIAIISVFLFLLARGSGLVTPNAIITLTSPFSPPPSDLQHIPRDELTSHKNNLLFRSPPLTPSCAKLSSASICLGSFPAHPTFQVSLLPTEILSNKVFH